MRKFKLPNIHNLLKLLCRRVVIISLLILLEAFLIVMIALRGNLSSPWTFILLYLLSLATALHIISNNTNPAYKIGWLAFVLLVPLVGALFYIILGGNKLSRRLRRKMSSMQEVLSDTLHQDTEAFEWLESQSPDAALQSRYLTTAAHCPGYLGTETAYYPNGELYFASVCEALEQAEHYIFIESFIIAQGTMWDTMLDILMRKAEEGVDVRLIYDDFGCITRLPYQYKYQLGDLGIQCEVFNPFVPIISSRLNNRDHRKFVLVDGHTAFTGGINLADEYINAERRFGQWKDAGVRVRGEAAWSMTVMFLSMWGYQRGIREPISKFWPTQPQIAAQGFIQPYTDNPLDGEPVGETVYFNLITRARKYIRIMTPYLITDSEILTALTAAAKSGVEITIITPHIPDKWYVHAMTRAYYEHLLDVGVHIYEYTPGFIHSKVFCVDGLYATVGTVNLDFRSLYLHFEDGVWMYKAACIPEIERDFDETLPICEEIPLSACTDLPLWKRLRNALLRLLAPLM